LLIGFQIYSSIEEYKTGEPKVLPFKEGDYLNVYNELVSTWEKFEAKKKDNAREVLASIRLAVL
jgi:hypothetical protein